MATDAGPSKGRSGLSLAVGDALATAFFVFVSSTFEEVLCPAWSTEFLVGQCKRIDGHAALCITLQVAERIAPALGITGLFAGLSVLVTGLIVFGPVAEWLGGPGALFNPSHNLAFAALGDGRKRVHLMRMVCCCKLMCIRVPYTVTLCLMTAVPVTQRNFRG